MTDEQIKHMRDRFLMWKLPADFKPDCGIQFDADGAKKLNPQNHRYEPNGTNLFDAQQAEAMVRHMIWDLPGAPEDACSDARLRELWKECGGEWHGGEARPCQAMPDDLPDILRRIITATTRAAAGLPVQPVT